MKYTPDFSSRFRILKGGKISLVVSALLGGSVIAHAAPSGGTLTSGSATISQSGTVTTIDQSTNKASINWQNFSIGSHETVNFNQPNVNSITLNRVIGTEKSVIDGALNANGQVWILNSNGVLFGKNAAVNTSGILATTAELSDTDFQAGNYAFKNATSNAVVNLGTIEVPNSGSVVLASNEVINSGTIKAVHGKVHLVGANSYSLNLNGNSLVNLRVDTGVLDALVSNSGNILADGGEIYLTTNAVNELLKGVVNNTGLIEANSIDGISGYVELFAHGGTANISGNINAKDGFVETSGDTVKINDDFRVTADKWLIDPKDFTIAASGGDITGATLSSNLESASVEIQSVNGATDGNGDIVVNDAVSWNAETALTLNAQNNIYINDTITSTNGALILLYGQATSTGGTSDYYINAKVNLKAGDNFATQLGSNQSNFKGWTTITPDNLATAITSGGLGHNYVLGSDLDLSGINWTPIGNDTTPFTGNFDGLGHTVDNLTINRPTEFYIGLFGYTDGATIKNIGVINVEITGGDGAFVGGLVGYNGNGSTVSNAYSTGSVTGGDNTYVGGLVGYNSSSTVSNSYSQSSVTGIADANVGGLVGCSSDSTISNSYSTGSVTGGDDAVVGGLVGGNESSTVSNSYSTGSVTGADYAFVGGVGGLVGYNSFSSTVSNSYSTGSVTGGSGATLGGLVGYNESSTVSNSYSTGSVIGGSGATLGGLVGYNYSSSIVSNSYYDKTLVTGMLDESSYGKTTTELKTPTTFSTWDDAIWSFSTGGGASVAGYEVGEASYPYLTTVTADADKPTGTNVILFSGGFGTSANPYTITNWTQLQNINNSNILTQNYYFSLLNDLSSTTTDYTNLASSTANSGAGWNPIGYFIAYPSNYKGFTGNFDGQNYTISDLYINRPNSDWVGLFAYVYNSSISNLGVTNANISAGYNVGALAGNLENSTIQNSYSSGNITGNDYAVGGLVGFTWNSTIANSHSTANATGLMEAGGLVGSHAGDSIITDSYATGRVEVTYTTTAKGAAGGLVGYVSGDSTTGSRVINSYATGEVIGKWGIGGLVGYTDYHAMISNSYATGSVTGTKNVGGLVGYNYWDSIVSNSYATGDVTGTENVGGLVGWNYDNSIIANSYSVGNVSGTKNVGGLVGFNLSSTVSNSYSTVSVTGGDNAYVGGLVGYNTNSSTISNSYFTGSVTGGTGAFVGGLVGYNASSTISNSYSASSSITGTYAGGLVGANASSTVDNSYYDKTLVAGMAGEATYGKTTTELRDLTTQNWDDTIWTFLDGAQEGFGVYIRPYLKDVTTQADKPSTFTLFAGGFGTSSDAYEITNWTQLQNINHSNILTQNYYFSLLNNLSSTTSDYTNLASSTANSGAGWKPIGDSTFKFTGTFDGANKTIDSLFMNRPTDEYYIGLFGHTSGATIKNIGVTNVDITGGDYAYVGGLIGYNSESTVSNAYSTGSVTGGTGASVGGLVGQNYISTVSNAYSQASVTGVASAYVGGLVGYNSESTVSNSYSTGSATGGDNAYVGGLVGYDFYGTVSNAYSTGSVTGGTGAFVRGLVGQKYYSKVSNAYYDKTLVTGMLDEYDYGKTTKEMQTLATFGDAGWDIVLDETQKKIYPYLTFDETGGAIWKVGKYATALNYILGTANTTYNGTDQSLTNFWTNTIFGENGSQLVAGTDYKFLYDSSDTTSFKNAGTYSDISVVILNEDYELDATGTNTLGNFIIAKANATVTANSDTKTYNGLAQSVNGFSASGLVNGETIAVLDGVSASATGTNAGTYTATATGTDENYNLTFVEGSLVINKADAMVTANSDTKTYNGLAQSVNGFSASGLVNGETIAVLDGVSASATGTNAGTYTATATGTDENYNLTFVEGSMVINPKSITLKADDLSKVYGSHDPILTYIAEGIIGNDVLEGLLQRASGDNAGTYVISQGNLVNPNYSITFNDGIFTIQRDSVLDNTITPIVNNIVVPQIPTFDVKPMATAPQAQPIVMTSTSQMVNLLSQPLQNQNTTMVTMGELQANHDSNTPNPNSDIRVPVGDNSIIELVNGGVHLPDGVEQQFFVVADKTN